jgi:hypothetical protein
MRRSRCASGGPSASPDDHAPEEQPVGPFGRAVLQSAPELVGRADGLSEDFRRGVGVGADGSHEGPHPWIAEEALKGLC